MLISENDVRQRLETVTAGQSEQNVIEAHWIDSIQLNAVADDVVDVVLLTRSDKGSDDVWDACRTAVGELAGVGRVTIGTVRKSDDGEDSQGDSPSGSGSSENADGALSEQRVFEELKKVIDPELFVNIVDLGLIYEVTLTEADEALQDVQINMTMTSPMCPAGPQMIANCKQVLGRLAEVGNVEVKIVLDPPWTPEKMSDDARDQLGIF